MLNPDLIYETYLDSLTVPRSLLQSKIMYSHYLQNVIQQPIKLKSGLFNFDETPFDKPIEMYLYQVECSFRTNYILIKLTPELFTVFNYFDQEMDDIVHNYIPMIGIDHQSPCKSDKYVKGTLTGSSMSHYCAYHCVLNCTVFLTAIDRNRSIIIKIRLNY